MRTGYVGLCRFRVFKNLQSDCSDAKCFFGQMMLKTGFEYLLELIGLVKSLCRAKSHGNFLMGKLAN